MNPKNNSAALWPVLKFRGILKKVNDFTLIVEPFPTAWHLSKKCNVSGDLVLSYGAANSSVELLAIGGLYEFTVGVSILQNRKPIKLGFLYLTHVVI